MNQGPTSEGERRFKVVNTYWTREQKELLPTKKSFPKKSMVRDNTEDWVQHNGKFKTNGNATVMVQLPQFSQKRNVVYDFHACNMSNHRYDMIL